ncbi:hypothetical protein GW17_00001798 [Ensete ventricosum]|nr:hypothetical protein GW17_00001798 [Ensete ventricosum]
MRSNTIRFLASSAKSRTVCLPVLIPFPLSIRCDGIATQFRATTGSKPSDRISPPAPRDPRPKTKPLSISLSPPLPLRLFYLFDSPLDSAEGGADAK